MRRPMIGLAIVLGLAGGASTGRAQNVGGVFNDPFSLYYGLYLPRQAALASQTTSQDVINAQAVTRQDATLQSERAGLYEDIRPFGLEELDPTNAGLRQKGTGRGYERRARAVHISSNGALGPSQYYGLARQGGIASYYPTVRTGRGPNLNVPQRSRFNRAPSTGAIGGGAGTSASIGAGFR